MALNIALYMLAVVNMLYGAFALVFPGEAADLVGFELRDDSSYGEVRALHGGLVLAIGIVIFEAVRRPAWRRLLDAIGLCFLGLVFGRLISLAVDGFSGYTLTAGAFEVVAASLLLYAGIRRTENQQ